MNIPKIKRIKDSDAIKKATKPRCELCMERAYGEPHHIKSVGSGGGDVPENLIQLCAICHVKAHNAQISKDTLREIVARR